MGGDLDKTLGIRLGHQKEILIPKGGVIMTRFRIAILIVTIIFAFSLIGSQLALAKGEKKLSAQERKLLASLNPKNTALFLQTIRKGVEILKGGGTNQKVKAAVQAPLKTLSRGTGISEMQLESLATNIMRDVEGYLQTLREMPDGQEKLLQALWEYVAELERASDRASRQEGRYAEVEFWDYTLTTDNQVMVTHTPHAHAAEETEEAENHAALTGRETHSFRAIQRELTETRAQIRAVNETITIVRNFIRQLSMLLRK